MNDKPNKAVQDFTGLVEAVRRVHDECAAAVNRAVNTTLTIRNWLIGGYIHHYELHGADRAQYGERLMDRLADALRPHKIPATDRQRLYAYVSFYRTYPQIAQAIPQGLPSFDNADTIKIFRTPSGKSQSANDESEIFRTATGQLALPAEKLLGSLSYSHLEQLTALDTPLKRAFYEIECIRGNWSVRTLKRQIATLYYERSSLSVDKEKLADMAHAVAEKAEPKLAIRDPYVSWYRKHMMTEGDNPPVGLLLCTQKDHTLVEYATANIDNRLFVSKYQLELPKKEELERFLQTKRREITEG